jgi:hypothetical protein
MFRLIFITGFVIKSVVVASSMKLVKEQIICVKFCFKVGRTDTETHMLREAYGNDALSQTMSGLANLQLQDLNH